MIQRGRNKWKMAFPSKHVGYTTTGQRYTANPGIVLENVAGPTIVELPPLQV